MVTGAFKNKGKFTINQEKTRWMVLDELKYNEIKKNNMIFQKVKPTNNPKIPKKHMKIKQKFNLNLSCSYADERQEYELRICNSM